MNCCHAPMSQNVQLGTTRVLVTELSGSGYINPTPAEKSSEYQETTEELYLSTEKLQSLCGTWDLSRVTSLELCIDTQENTLGKLGVLLPKLVQLKMNNSKITSIRDLGTSLSQLQVLWMSRCFLQDLDGICIFTHLKELYIAHNRVSDLSQLGMLENLQLLDLEGNNVDDIFQVQYLGLCGKLKSLTLEGNPVCERPSPTTVQTTDYRYRATVRELLPQLHYLDNERAEELELSCSSTMGEEWAILQNSIRDGSPSQNVTKDEEAADAAWPYSRPGSSRCPASSCSSIWPFPPTVPPENNSRPMSRSGVLCSPVGSRPGSAESDVRAVEAETSILTHGAGKIVYCGNPVQAIRARREKQRMTPPRLAFTPPGLLFGVVENSSDPPEPAMRDCEDVFAELRAWREQQSRCLQAREKKSLGQVLVIQHHDEEKEGEEGNSEESLSDNWSYSGEKHGGKHADSPDTSSPDSMYQSLSPDLCQREAVSPDVSQKSLSPSSPDSAADLCKQQGFRVRRLRLKQANPTHLRSSVGTGTTNSESDSVLQQVTRTHSVLRLPRLPPQNTKEPMDPGVDKVLLVIPGVESGRESPPTSRMSTTCATTRPPTAMAALQKFHLHHPPQSCRGSSHPD